MSYHKLLETIYWSKCKDNVDWKAFEYFIKFDKLLNKNPLMTKIYKKMGPVNQSRIPLYDEMLFFECIFVVN